MEGREPVEKKQNIRLLGNILCIQAGSILAAFSLERFLVPNRFIGGDAVSYLSALPLGVLVFAFNLPFLVLSLRPIGKKFLLHALHAVASFPIRISVFRTEIVSNRSMEISKIKNAGKGDK
jgi:uncharacterized membrane-anchored protein YitT (DUF2179 family)